MPGLFIQSGRWISQHLPNRPGASANSPANDGGTENTLNMELGPVPDREPRGLTVCIAPRPYRSKPGIVGAPPDPLSEWGLACCRVGGDGKLRCGVVHPPIDIRR